MTDTLLTDLTVWLAGAPALADVPGFWVDLSGPMPGTGGVFPAGVTVLESRRNLWGDVTLRCRAQFALRLVLPFSPQDPDGAAANAARLLDLQGWVAAQSAAGLAPVFGSTDVHRETLAAEQGRLESVRADGTAVYALRLTAQYTQLYEEESQ